ncbi:MAG: GNAT family N-acetyltransferase [Oscillospiraceae bacterium]|jgi:RimJ/RimL family protein N-acetyltransferase|nr:GNAT family N-acetyltransferase [Oscillospiraceae bacterium]
MIKGKKVELVPARLSDRQNIYDWCYHSETTKSHSGPPDYPEAPIATWKEFFDEGYVDYYFTGAEPEKGRGFMIRHGGEPVGFISYSSFHLKPCKSELDIWMNSEAHCGKGFGTDAIIALGAYLNEHLGVNELIMRPSVRNERAVRAYRKAGFETSEEPAGYYLLDEYMPLYGAGDYGEGGDILLVKRFHR